MTAEKLPVTVAVPVKNEEAGLPACLERLGRFAEVVVIDSGSTDRTVEIAESFGARVLQFAWNGRYPKKRNWFLIEHPPQTPWVLFLDADEIVDDAFCDALAAALTPDAPDGFWLRYTNHFMGRELRHGVPQRKLALLRTGRALYERIEEAEWSRLDMEIHEHPVVEGPVGEIAAPIDHRDDRGLARFLNRHVDYARWEAGRLKLLQDDPAAWAALTPRQRFKYRNVTRWWFPWFYFLAAYVGKRGLLDGAAGFRYAFYKAWYFQTVRLMIHDADRRPA